MEGKAVKDIKIAIISEPEAVLEQLKGMIKEYAEPIVMEYKEIKTELDRLAPDLVFFLVPEDDSTMDLMESVHQVVPFAPIIVISKSSDFELLRHGTKNGVTEFFVLPDEMSMLMGRLESIIYSATEKKRYADEAAATKQSFKRGRGKIYSFYSGKGGCGKTLISSAFAQTLKLESTAQVLLLDLNLQYGGAETYLSIESNRSFTDLLPVMEELNEGHIRNVSEKEKYSKLDVLLSPRDAEIAEKITEEIISKLLRICRRSYDFVIVDLPVVMNENTYAALEESDKVYYIITPETPSITMFKQVDDLFKRLGFETENRLEIVINEVGRENEIMPKDIKDIIHFPISTKLPRDIKGIQKYINKSEPLRKEQKEKKLIPFSKGIQKWVVNLVE